MSQNKDYKIVIAETGISGTDKVNEFTTKNPQWSLFNVISHPPGFAFIFEKDKERAPTSTPPTGGTTAALLTENNIIPMRRAA